jgi:hypothetical protein
VRLREQAEPERDDARALLQTWRAAFTDREITAKDAIAIARGNEDLREALQPYALDKLGNLDARPLGYALRGLMDRVVGGLVLRRGEKKCEKGQTWAVRVHAAG